MHGSNPNWIGDTLILRQFAVLSLLLQWRVARLALEFAFACNSAPVLRESRRAEGARGTPELASITLIVSRHRSDRKTNQSRSTLRSVMTFLNTPRSWIY